MKGQIVSQANLLDVAGLNLQHKTKQIVGSLSFSIKSGETLALVGESGSGKTLSALSILKLLPNGVVLSKKTKILFEGENLRSFPEYRMRSIRGKRIAMIFQEPMLALNPVLTIQQQLLEVLKLHTNLDKAAQLERAATLLIAVGLNGPQTLFCAYPHQLSGGMRQRVMIAMALATEPDLLIADEPTTALDVTVQAKILNLLQSLQKKYQLAVLFISHDLTVVKQVADRIAVLYQGHLLELGTASEFFSNAKHPYSEMLFRSLPSFKQRDYFLSVSEKYTLLENNLKRCPFLNRCRYRQDRCFAADPSWLQLTPTRGYLCHFTSLPYQQAPISKEKAPQKRLRDVLLTFEGICKTYPIQGKNWFKRKQPLAILKGVSGKIRSGETLALVGGSGSGKTTLAKILMKLEQANSGSIDFGHLKPCDIQMIFQDPHSAMDPKWTIRDILSEGLKARKMYGAHSKTFLMKLLEKVGLDPNSLDDYPYAFSGGQKQRIVIARALAVKPKLIICDEPTSALDVSIQAQLLNLLRQLQIDTGIAYLFITHNMNLVAYLADTMIVLEQGCIVEQGEVRSILKSPRHAYTQKLLASVPQLASMH